VVSGTGPGTINAAVTGLKCFFDSPVICECLGSLHACARLVPVAGEARWASPRQRALADGLLSAAVSLRCETVLRPEAFASRANDSRAEWQTD